MFRKVSAKSLLVRFKNEASLVNQVGAFSKTGTVPMSNSSPIRFIKLLNPVDNSATTLCYFAP